MKRILTAVLLIALLGLPQAIVAKPQSQQVDICIYGATSAGIIAAYTAQREGKSVLLIEPSTRIGGLTAGGLGMTDIGKVDIIQGLALNFYKRVGKKYKQDKPQFIFEPKVALSVFNDYLHETSIDVWKPFRLIKVTKSKTRITQITLENSLNPTRASRRTVEAKIFIDCSYEGDLMAQAGVSYTVGREANSQYNETYNGVQMREYHQFPDGVDPYRIKGNPKSGLLYGISSLPMGKAGEADKHVQAYNFRITLTNDPSNRIPITRPDRYDSTRYELLLRWKEVEPWKHLSDAFAWDAMPGNKTDINNRGGFSTDMIGENWNYPEASYSERKKIWQKHLDYTLGLLYFCGHDQRIPEHIRQEILSWGLPEDEYQESNHFTPQLYLRETRRMVGRYVMTQANCEQRDKVDDLVGWAAYTMDSHNSGRFVVNGMVKNEGDVQIRIPGPYGVSYRSITPQEKEAQNLLVPVCLSASHIAYGSIRMEPVFMVLGQTSALAACQAIEKHHACVQQVDAASVMKQFKKQ